MNINAAFPGAYLKAADLQGRAVRVQIQDCVMEHLDDGDKPLLTFAGKDRGLILNKTNGGILAAALGDDYVLLVRAHYFLRNTDGAASRAIDVSAYPNSNEIALISDLLITDYSSLMFDFACLRRPIVLYQYDYQDYLDRRGVYFEIRDIPPGPIVETREALQEVLASRGFESPESLRQIQAFADRFAPWDDGKATQRVLEQVFNL